MLGNCDRRPVTSTQASQNQSTRRSFRADFCRPKSGCTKLFPGHWEGKRARQITAY
ncbi:hypothetical protein V6Z11_D13G136600 [Gossypium hirsutum]